MAIPFRAAMRIVLHYVGIKNERCPECGHNDFDCLDLCLVEVDCPCGHGLDICACRNPYHKEAS